MKKKKKNLTQKQRKLVKQILENIGKRGFTKTVEQMMLNSGYSVKMARAQRGIIDSPTIQAELSPIVQGMLKERNAVIKAMGEKRNEAKYRDLTDALDKLTKNIQLLSGKETQRLEITGYEKLKDEELNDELRKKLKKGGKD